MEGQPGDYYGGSAWRLPWRVSLEITMGVSLDIIMEGQPFCRIGVFKPLEETSRRIGVFKPLEETSRSIGVLQTLGGT